MELERVRKNTNYTESDLDHTIIYGENSTCCFAFLTYLSPQNLVQVTEPGMKMIIIQSLKEPNYTV